MSGVSDDIPNLGSSNQMPRQNSAFDPGKQKNFTSEDYYVWSRVDGRTTLRELLLMVGFPLAKATDIVSRLHQTGAILLGDETPQSVAHRLTTRCDDKAQEVIDPEGWTEEEQRALEEEGALTKQERKRVIEMRHIVATGSYFDVLGVEKGVNKRVLKRAYFRVSKEFHPDRYYGKSTGSFGPWLAEVFQQARKAFDTFV